MLYNLKNIYDKQKFREDCNKYYQEEDVVELTKKRVKRTLRQNSYYQLITAYFGAEIGYTHDEVKVEIFKKTCNREIFEETVVNNRGQKITRLRSSASLNTEEMTRAIERFRNYSASVVGLYIPSPEEPDAIIYARQQIQKNLLYI